MIEGIIDILKTNPGVQDIVGTNTAGDQYKVYPVRYPQEERESPDKYLTVYKTPGEPVQNKDVTTDELELATFNVNCYATNYSDAIALYKAVRAALDIRDSFEKKGYNYFDIWFTGDYDAFDDGARRFIHVCSFATHTNEV